MTDTLVDQPECRFCKQPLWGHVLGALRICEQCTELQRMAKEQHAEEALQERKEASA